MCGGDGSFRYELSTVPVWLQGEFIFLVDPALQLSCKITTYPDPSSLSLYRSVCGAGIIFEKISTGFVQRVEHHIMPTRMPSRLWTVKI
jgi:hypothetical protein